jgi:hypothetical protein
LSASYGGTAPNPGVGDGVTVGFISRLGDGSIVWVNCFSYRVGFVEVGVKAGNVGLISGKADVAEEETEDICP